MYRKHEKLDDHKSFDASLHNEMSVWRKATLNKLLLLFAVINAAVTTIQFGVILYVPSLGETVFVIFFCVVLFLLACLRSIPHFAKGTFLLFLVYAGITKQLWMHGLILTAPISLTLIPLIAFLLINPLTGWISGIASAVLFLVFTIVHQQYYRLTLHTIQKEKAQAHKITAAQTATIFAMAKLAEFRDTNTGGHLERVREYSRLLADAMQPDTKYRHVIDAAFIENIYHASALHDIGKVAIADAILRKPGKLSEDEFAIMKSHTTVGAEKLQIVYANYPDNHFLHMGIRIALTHHEWWNGEGYPYGLEGEAIPLEGRIMALADAYDALTSERPYKKPFSHAKSREIIVAHQGRQFEADVVSAFIACQHQFAVISQSHLSDGMQKIQQTFTDSKKEKL